MLIGACLEWVHKLAEAGIGYWRLEVRSPGLTVEFCMMM